MNTIINTQYAVILIILLVGHSKATPLSIDQPGVRAEPLSCYNCTCFDATCPCTTYEVSSLETTYCIILRQQAGQYVTINLGHVDLYSTARYIRDYPYVLVEESITYDERVARWYTTTNTILYGCNWNLCNKPGLIPLLPDSFQMRLPEAWLNTSVLGTGQPQRDCHECPDAPQCSTSEFLDVARCPIRTCNTTCVVSDSFDDSANDYFCYQSYCMAPDIDQVSNNQHRVEIEGIVYASQPNVVDIWEIDLYCRADDCSRPEVFKELREQLYLQPGNLAALFNETHDPTIPQRRCYDCYCLNDPTCLCNRTTVMPASSTYCIIMRENLGQEFWVSLEHVNQNSTQVYIRDFPYILVEESIVYSEQTGRWSTISNFAIYGCNWDLCNHPGLVPYLPSSFQMRLSEAWLNTSILGTGQPTRDCHECPEAPQCGTSDFLDIGRCPIQACNTTCLVFDTFNDPANDLLCYQSFCGQPGIDDFENNRHRVEIEGIIYLRKQPREVDIWEIDIYCRADDCSRPEIFNEMKSNLTLVIGDISIFDQQTPSTATQAPSTTTQTPVPSIASIHVVMNLFSLSFMSILLINFQ